MTRRPFSLTSRYADSAGSAGRQGPRKGRPPRWTQSQHALTDTIRVVGTGVRHSSQVVRLSCISNVQHMPNPTVTVVIPAYRVADVIAEALESVFAQTFRDFGVVLINDGCPDTINLEKALEPYLGRITYIKQVNQGQAAARNAGIRATESPFVAFLDGDDVWEPEYLEAHLDALQKDERLDVVYPNAVYFGDSPLAGRLFMDVLPSEGEVTVLSLITGKCHVFIGATVRRGAIERAGGFDPDPAVRSVEDMDLWLRLAAGGARFAYHRRPLVRYRQRSGSQSDDRTRILRALICVLRKLSASSSSDELKQQIDREVEKLAAHIKAFEGKSALYRGEFKTARSLLGEANKVLRQRRIGVACFLLRVTPGVLHSYIHRRHATERSFLL